MKIQAIFDAKNFCDFVERYCHKVAHRSILIDRYCDGLTFAELADKYNYPERSIKSKDLNFTHRYICGYFFVPTQNFKKTKKK